MSINTFCYIFCISHTRAIWIFSFCFILSCLTRSIRNISTADHNRRVALRICRLTNCNSTLLTTCFRFITHRNIAQFCPRSSTCCQGIRTIRYRTHTNSYRSFCIWLYCGACTDSCGTESTHTHYRVCTNGCTQCCSRVGFHTDDYRTRLTIGGFISSWHTATY